MRKLISVGAAVTLLGASITSAFAASGGSSTLQVNKGNGLSVTGAAPGNFAVTLNGQDQTVDGTLGTFTAQDTTGTGNGWNVTLQASQFNTTTPKADTLDAGSLLVDVPSASTCASGTRSCAQGRAAVPTAAIAAPTTIDSNASGFSVKFVHAAADNGMGTYTFPATALHLFVPSTAYTQTYTSNLTVSIISGP